MSARSLRMPSRYALASLFVMAFSLVHSARADASQLQTTPGAEQVKQALQSLAIPFEANNGHFDERVLFVGRTLAGPVYVTREGQIVYSLPSLSTESNNSDHAWSLTETLVGTKTLKPYGGEQVDTQVSRFMGSQGYQAVTYRNVLLGQAWPGIEVELAARGNNVEKLFHVLPYADAGRIEVRLAGAQSLRVGDGGELIAQTGHGEVAYTAPVAFQQVGGQRFDVPVKYVLNKEGDGYSFALGMYDRTRVLVIDPLLQSSYLGGTAQETLQRLAIDAKTKDILVAGYSISAEFPGTAGGVQVINGGDYDGLVARLSSDLKTLRQSTYLGGAGDDVINGLAIDAATGDVLVGGYTNSSNFPGMAGGAQPGPGGGQDGFVARLSGDLKSLRQSTYLGGGGHESVVNLTLDAATGDVLVGGSSTSADLPGAAGGAQPGFGGQMDGLVARLSGDLKTLRQSTYLGGAGDEQVSDLVIDAATGDVLVGGYGQDVPGTADGAQPASGGGQDGFVVRMSGDLKTLQRSTYLGGSGNFDYVYGMAIDAATGDVLVGGSTDSVDLPGTAGGAQPGLGGAVDGFVARLSGNLKSLRQSTYLGGSGGDVFGAPLIDAATGDVLVSGYTTSTDLPGSAGGMQPGFGGGNTDGFVARLSGELKTLRQSTYLGGAGDDFIITPVLDAATGDLLLVGGTDSTNMPGTAGGAQPALSGNIDGYVARLSGDLRAVSPQTITFPQQAERDFVAGGGFAIDPPATASSGLPVSYASSTPGVCRVAGNVVTMVSAGTCTVVAGQGGNAQWEPAADVAVSLELTDKSGPVTPEPPVLGNATPVPAVGLWGLVLMGLLAGGLGLGQLRQRGSR